MTEVGGRETRRARFPSGYTLGATSLSAKSMFFVFPGRTDFGWLLDVRLPQFWLG